MHVTQHLNLLFNRKFLYLVKSFFVYFLIIIELFITSLHLRSFVIMERTPLALLDILAHEAAYDRHIDVPGLALSVLLHCGRALCFVINMSILFDRRNILALVINMSILFDLRNILALEAGYVGVVGDGDEDVLVLRVLLHQSLAPF